MSVPLYEIVGYASGASVVVPIIVYLLRLRRHPLTNQIIGVWVIGSLIFDGINLTMYRLDMPTLPSVNFYFFFSFVALNMFYYRLLYRERHAGIFYVGVLTYLIYLIFTLTTINLFTPMVKLWSAGGMIIAAHSLNYTRLGIFRSPQSLLDPNLYSSIIINGSISFYFLATMFIFLMSEYFADQMTREIRMLSGISHNVVNIIKNIGLAVGLYYTGRRKVDITIEQLEEIDNELRIR